jgi:hypothetical protein
MLEPQFETLWRDVTGEGALTVLPQRGRWPDELLLLGEPVESIDGWGAAALRTKIEYVAGHLQRRVVLSLPRDSGARLLLYHLLGGDPPRHLVVADDSPPVDEPAPRTILLPAIPVPTEERATMLAEHLWDRAKGDYGRALALIAKNLPELVWNSLVHASSPTAPVVCVFHERDEDELQLVVCDLGDSVAAGPNPAAHLANLVIGRDGGLESLVGSATARRIDLTLTLATGIGRLYWRAGTWQSVTAVDEPVAGFAAALTVPLA